MALPDISASRRTPIPAASFRHSVKPHMANTAFKAPVGDVLSLKFQGIPNAKENRESNKGFLHNLSETIKEFFQSVKDWFVQIWRWITGQTTRQGFTPSHSPSEWSGLAKTLQKKLEFSRQERKTLQENLHQAFQNPAELKLIHLPNNTGLAIFTPVQNKTYYQHASKETLPVELYTPEALFDKSPGEFIITGKFQRHGQDYHYQLLSPQNFTYLKKAKEYFEAYRKTYLEKVREENYRSVIYQHNYAEQVGNIIQAIRRGEKLGLEIIGIDRLDPGNATLIFDKEPPIPKSSRFLDFEAALAGNNLTLETFLNETLRLPSTTETENPFQTGSDSNFIILSKPGFETFGIRYNKKADLKRPYTLVPYPSPLESSRYLGYKIGGIKNKDGETVVDILNLTAGKNPSQLVPGLYSITTCPKLYTLIHATTNGATKRKVLAAYEKLSKLYAAGNFNNLGVTSLKPYQKEIQELLFPTQKTTGKKLDDQTLAEFDGFFSNYLRYQQDYSNYIQHLANLDQTHLNHFIRELTSLKNQPVRLDTDQHSNNLLIDTKTNSLSIVDLNEYQGEYRQTAIDPTRSPEHALDGLVSLLLLRVYNSDLGYYPTRDTDQLACKTILDSGLSTQIRQNIPVIIKKLDAAIEQYAPEERQRFYTHNEEALSDLERLTGAQLIPQGFRSLKKSS